MTLSNEKLTWFGRNFDHDGKRWFSYSASGFEFSMTGKKAVAKIFSDPERWSDANKGWLQVFVMDDKAVKSDNFWEGVPSTPSKQIKLEKAEDDYVLFESDEIRTVKIRVIRQSEAAFGLSGLSSIEIDGEYIEPVVKTLGNQGAFSNKIKLEYIGDSITCGYGIDGVFEKDNFDTKIERPDLGYAYNTAKKLDAQFHCVSWSGIGITSTYIDPSIDEVDNIWTMPAVWPYTDRSAQIRLGLEPEVWDASQYEPDAVVINLGTNDQSYTRHILNREKTFICNYRKLMEEVHRRSPKANIMCCLGVMGQDLCPQIEKAVEMFKKDFPSIKVKFVKFPVQLDEDGIAADWHPSAVTHAKMAEQLSKELRELL